MMFPPAIPDAANVVDSLESVLGRLRGFRV